MKIKIDIPEHRINDLLTGHGGQYSSWLREFVSGDWRKNNLIIRFDRTADDEGEGKGRTTITRARVIDGLEKMAKSIEGGRHFGDFISEDDDDLTYDCAWQFIVFGKLVYA